MAGVGRQGVAARVAGLVCLAGGYAACWCRTEEDGVFVLSCFDQFAVAWHDLLALAF